MRTTFLCGILGLAFLGCASAPAPKAAPAPAADEAPVPTVTPEQGHALVKDGATLVDVRRADEFAEKHIEGAVNIPIDDLPARADELGAKDQPLLLYCHSGRRADRGAKILREAGFTKVETLGGMDKW